jgi:hypothetical protein
MGFLREPAPYNDFWLLPGAVPTWQVLNKAEASQEEKQHLGMVAWLLGGAGHVVSSF